MYIWADKLTKEFVKQICVVDIRHQIDDVMLLIAVYFSYTIQTKISSCWICPTHQSSEMRATKWTNLTHGNLSIKVTTFTSDNIIQTQISSSWIRQNHQSSNTKATKWINLTHGNISILLPL